MASPKFDRDEVAKILIDAANIGDAAACEKYGIERTTLYRYRKKLGNDPHLQQVATQKKRLQDEAWANKIPGAIADCIDFISEATKMCKRDDPEALHAVGGVFKLLTEVHLTREILQERLNALREERAIDVDAQAVQ